MIDDTPFAGEPAWSRLKERMRILARKEVMSRFHRVSASHKADGSLVSAADRAMQQAVEHFLHEQWPEYAFLGEESECGIQNQALAQQQGCWILDPLDGTTNFIHGFELFSCSLALAIGGEVVLGMVYDPVRDETFAARRGLGAELDGRPLRISGTSVSLQASLALVDYKRLPRGLAVALVEAPPFASQRNLGTVALDWCWMAASRADLYLHGGQKLWDYAAGQLIFSEAGGASCTLDAEQVPSNSVESRSAVAAGTSTLLELWMAHLDANR
ncbi:inositol monophosphatase family protein [Thiolapillus sp.]